MCVYGGSTLYRKRKGTVKQEKTQICSYRVCSSSCNAGKIFGVVLRLRCGRVRHKGEEGVRREKNKKGDVYSLNEFDPEKKLQGLRSLVPVPLRDWSQVCVWEEVKMGKEERHIAKWKSSELQFSEVCKVQRRERRIEKNEK